MSSLVRKHQKKIPEVGPLIPGVLAKKVSVAAHRLHQHECTFDQSHRWYKLQSGHELHEDTFHFSHFPKPRDELRLSDC